MAPPPRPAEVPPDWFWDGVVWRPSPSLRGRDVVPNLSIRGGAVPPAPQQIFSDPPPLEPQPQPRPYWARPQADDGSGGAPPGLSGPRPDVGGYGETVDIEERRRQAIDPNPVASRDDDPRNRRAAEARSPGPADRSGPRGIPLSELPADWKPAGANWPDGTEEQAPGGQGGGPAIPQDEWTGNAAPELPHGGTPSVEHERTVGIRESMGLHDPFEVERRYSELVAAGRMKPQEAALKTKVYQDWYTSNKGMMLRHSRMDIEQLERDSAMTLNRLDSEQWTRGQAIQAYSEGLGALAKRETMDKGIEERTRRNIDRQMLAYEEAIMTVEAGRIDPDKWWKERGTGGRIAAGIAMMLMPGAVAGQIADGIHSAINEDVAKQVQVLESRKAGLAGRGSLIGLMQQQLRDLPASASAAKAYIYERLGMQLEQYGTQGKSRAYDANRQLLKDSFDAQAEQALLTLQLRLRGLAMQQTAGTPKPQEEDTLTDDEAKRYVDPWGGLVMPGSESQITEIRREAAEYQFGRQVLDDMSQLAKKPSTYWTREDGQKYRMGREWLVAAARKKMFGASFTAGEQALAEDHFPADVTKTGNRFYGEAGAQTVDNYRNLMLQEEMTKKQAYGLSPITVTYGQLRQLKPTDKIKRGYRVDTIPRTEHGRPNVEAAPGVGPPDESPGGRVLEATRRLAR